MEWLNYHHLLYFWTVAKHGSITAACRELRLRQPTVSTQLHALEESLGVKLLNRSGKSLVPTEQGMLVLRYAEQIFNTGRELLDVIKDRKPSGTVHLVVGVADVLPKQVAYKLLEPIYEMKDPHHIFCQENSPEILLADLALHKLDLVLSDAPVPNNINIKAYSHLLGESGVALYGQPALLESLRKSKKTSLTSAPLLLPTNNTSLRRHVDQWLAEHDEHPTIVGEFDDSALLKIFGQAGKGLFPAPTVIEKEIKLQYGVERYCELDGIKERFYVISVARQIRHPSVLAICKGALHSLELR
jgi:LysR family transcriptional activator of nhaA